MKPGAVLLVLLLILVTAAPVAPVAAREYDVYVLTGQSNSLGATANPNETDTSPGAHAADVQTRFFWANASTASGDPNYLVLYGDSGGVITTLQVQQGQGAHRHFWGPEFGFSRAMVADGQSNLMVIKASRGGGGNGFWVKGAGHMYGHILSTVTTATNLITSGGDTFEIKGLLYLQGESDSAAEASVAGRRLDELITNLRADLPHAADMRAVIGGIATAGDRHDLVRLQQSSLALGDPTIDYFSNLDLQGHLYDQVHFDKRAKLTVGRRFAGPFLRRAQRTVAQELTMNARNPLMALPDTGLDGRPRTEDTGVGNPR
jgi:Carbohydrate esterase, sialic acid-specific acetylesterase